jgi:hypothetical protein
LEHHETVECEYLTQQCSECEKLVFVSNVDEHRQMPRLCIPCPIKCTICLNYIEKPLLREHFHQCCQERINQLNRTAQASRQPVTPNHALVFIQTATNTVRLVEEQKQMSQLPTSFKGLGAVARAREQNCGHFYHILIMLKFILSNWSKIPFFILILRMGGFVMIGILLMGRCTLFSHWAYKNFHCGFFLIIFLSFFLTYGTSILFQLVSDTTIILSVGVLIFLWGCTDRAALEILEMNPLFNRPMTSVLFCGVEISIMKIILLLIRSYFWLMPIFMGASVITLINFYVGWKFHRAEIAVTRCQLPLPV